jgi:hypothetical protein
MGNKAARQRFRVYLRAKLLISSQDYLQIIAQIIMILPPLTAGG